MILQYSPYSFILLISAGVSIFVGILTMRRWAKPGSVWLALFMLAVAETSIGYAFEYATVGISGKLIWAKIEYLGVTTAPMFFLLFVMEYSRKDKLLNTWHMLALWIIPVLTLVLVFTNELHHLIWTSFTPAAHNLLIYGHGLWFWVYGVYSYSLVALATVLLVRVMTRFPRHDRSRIVALLVGILLPWISNAAYALDLIRIPGLDLTPAILSMMGAIMAYSVYRFELLGLTPVARDVLIEEMKDSVIVLDTQNRIVDINPAACRLFGVDKIPVGEFAPEFLGKWPALVIDYEETKDAHTEFLFGNEPPAYLDVHFSPVTDRRKNLVGKLIVLRDITHQKSIEQAERLGRQRLTGILETAPDGIVIVDINGRITFANPSAERLLGRSFSDLANRHYNAPEWRISAPDGSPSPDVDLAFAQVMKTGQPIYNLEYAFSHPDGRRVLLSVNAAPLPGADGRMAEVIVTLEDITQRLQAQQTVAQKAEELGILNRINLAITSGLDFDRVLKTLQEQCQQVVPSDVFYVALYEEQTGLIQIPLYYEKEYRPGPLLDLHSHPGLTGHVITSRQILYLRDTLDGTEPAAAPIIRTGGNPSRAYVGIPLILRDKVIGVMSVQSYQPSAYTDDHIHLLENIAVQAAIAIENARLYSVVQRIAIIDELTGTYNYRGLLELGTREVERARRFNHPLTTLFFDIDDFKNFNNKYSHATGNLILKSVADCCRVVLRSVDIVARYGGDEFFVLLPETDLVTGVGVAERLCGAIAAENITKDGNELSISVSMGLASLDDGIPDFLSLVDRANQAEHVAKLRGNSLVSWEAGLSGKPEKRIIYKIT
jgi:diguanylate cyclase (GGDEF)-like protein/PAS domain S-box-containing protein